MSLQGHYLCKFPAWYIIIINRMVACAHRVALAVLRGGQAASAESCTHPAKRDHRFPPPIAERQRLHNVRIWFTEHGMVDAIRLYHTKCFEYAHL